MDRNSWLALRHFPQLHTTPVNLSWSRVTPFELRATVRFNYNKQLVMRLHRFYYDHAFICHEKLPPEIQIVRAGFLSTWSRGFV